MGTKPTKRCVLLGTTLLSTLAITHAALAQTAKTTTAAAVTATDVGELVVTGSRIPRPNLEEPTPVTVLGAQTI